MTEWAECRTKESVILGNSAGLLSHRDQVTTSDSQPAETGLRSDSRPFPAVPRHPAVSDSEGFLNANVDSIYLKAECLLGEPSSVPTKITNKL